MLSITGHPDNLNRKTYYSAGSKAAMAAEVSLPIGSSSARNTSSSDGAAFFMRFGVGRAGFGASSSSEDTGLRMRFLQDNEISTSCPIYNTHAGDLPDRLSAAFFESVFTRFFGVSGTKTFL